MSQGYGPATDLAGTDVCVECKTVHAKTVICPERIAKLGPDRPNLAPNAKLPRNIPPSTTKLLGPRFDEERLVWYVLSYPMVHRVKEDADREKVYEWYATFSEALKLHRIDMCRPFGTCRRCAHENYRDEKTMIVFCPICDRGDHPEQAIRANLLTSMTRGAIIKGRGPKPHTTIGGRGAMRFGLEIGPTLWKNLMEAEGNTSQAELRADAGRRAFKRALDNAAPMIGYETYTIVILDADASEYATRAFPALATKLAEAKGSGKTVNSLRKFAEKLTEARNGGPAAGQPVQGSTPGFTGSEDGDDGDE